MSDFIPNKLSFDTVGAMDEITGAIDICLDELSGQFQEIIRKQIRENGNGSGIMKDEAMRHVKEFSRKFSGSVIELEVGVDEDIGDERARIRTVVVLHGNQNSGPLLTKPGQATWKKHVSFRSQSTATKVYHLDNLMQLDISGKLLENAMKEVEKYADDFLNAIEQVVSMIDFSQYVIVG